MKVAFFAPLPPAPTGVADYAAALLAGLRSQGDVEVGSETGVALYHVGNNHLHREIYQLALRRPGVVVLHDAVLHHFFLGTLGEQSYQAEFVYNYGEWLRGLAEQLWLDRARSAADPRYFDYPMLKRIARSARAVIVHNPAAAHTVRRHAPDAHVIEIPHLFIAAPNAPDKVEALRFRAGLGLQARTCLVGVFGHLRESKRLPVILRAMEYVWRHGADVRLLIQGSFASSDLERAIAPQLADSRIIRVGHLPELDFWRYASAADVCLNLRYPTASESSGIAIRMMGIGKPVVFTSGEEIARIPENACLRVDLGPGEEIELAEMILWLARDREAAADIGRRAACHIAAEHSIEKISRQYWEALKI